MDPAHLRMLLGCHDRARDRVLGRAVIARCVALLLVWPAAVWAQGVADAPRAETGGEWLIRCGAFVQADAAGIERAEAARCRGWIEGLIDLNEIYRGLGALERTAEGFCVPADATMREAAAAIGAYFEAHHDALRFSARVLAYLALRQAFPCALPRTA